MCQQQLTHGIAFSFTSLFRFCCCVVLDVGDKDDVLFQTPTPPPFWSTTPPPPPPLFSEVDMSSGSWLVADGWRFNMRPSLMLPELPSTWPLVSDVVISEAVDALAFVMLLLLLVCMMWRCWPRIGDLGALMEMGIGCCCCWLRACDEVWRTLWFWRESTIKYYLKKKKI